MANLIVGIGMIKTENILNKIYKMRQLLFTMVTLLLPSFMMAQASGGQIRRTNKSNTQRVGGSNIKPSIKTSNSAQQSRAEIPLYKVISERDKTCELVATKTDACISRMTKGKYVIPSKIRGYTVVSIGYNAFNECDQLESIVIPEGVKNISNYAFQRCASLKNVTVPQTVKFIDNGAFSHCSSLIEIKLPEGLTILSDNIFDGCTSLVSVYLPNSLSSIGHYTFNDCKSLKTISLPNQLKYLGDGMFSGCEALSRVSLPTSLTYINTLCFYKCKSLSSITLPEGISSISSSAFAECNSLTTISIPRYVKNIYEYAFSDCFNLRSVTLHSNDCTLKDNCFKNIHPDAILYLVNAKEFVYKYKGMYNYFSKIIEK